LLVEQKIAESIAAASITRERNASFQRIFKPTSHGLTRCSGNF